jgi:hypothetical protein
MLEKIEIIPRCSFSWEKLKEIKDRELNFGQQMALTC